MRRAKGEILSWKNEKNASWKEHHDRSDRLIIILGRNRHNIRDGDNDLNLLAIFLPTIHLFKIHWINLILH